MDAGSEGAIVPFSKQVPFVARLLLNGGWMSRSEGKSATAGALRSGPGLFSGLSAKILTLTMLFVLLAEVVIFVPSIAAMRLRWLQDRLSAAAAAGIVIDALQPADLPEKARDETLMAAGARAIALRKDGMSQLLASTPINQPIDAVYNLAESAPVEEMRTALWTLLFGGDRLIRAYGPVGDSSMMIDMVLEETALRNAMLVYARDVAMLSILISVITSTLIFFAIDRIMIGRIQRLTQSMLGFAADPADPGRILKPEQGADELSIASRELSAMQMELHETLKQQRTLAELGLAVSKINHDMRNILATAQLLSDRLSDVEDPMVKSFAPKLIRTLDRAVGYTGEVLAYGQMSATVPRRALMPLLPLALEVRDNLGLDGTGGIFFEEHIEPELKVDADGEQLFRVLHNLTRNAHQALLAEGAGGLIRMRATRQGSMVIIRIEDTGPGLALKARENLFAAFRGAARAGGTGLGLAIARDLVTAHGGTIRLVDGEGRGTVFEFSIPDRDGVDSVENL